MIKFKSTFGINRYIKFYIFKILKFDQLILLLIYFFILFDILIIRGYIYFICLFII